MLSKPHGSTDFNNFEPKPIQPPQHIQQPMQPQQQQQPPHFGNHQPQPQMPINNNMPIGNFQILLFIGISQYILASRMVKKERARNSFHQRLRSLPVPMLGARGKKLALCKQNFYIARFILSGQSSIMIFILLTQKFPDHAKTLIFDETCHFEKVSFAYYSFFLDLLNTDRVMKKKCFFFDEDYLRS